jgi:hypothetical protein
LLSQPLLSLASQLAVGHWLEVEVSPAARVAFTPVEMPDEYCRLGAVALDIFHPRFGAWLPAAGARWARRLLRLKHLHLWLRTRTGTGEVDWGAKTRSVEGKGNLLSRGKEAERLVCCCWQGLSCRRRSRWSVTCNWSCFWELGKLGVIRICSLVKTCSRVTTTLFVLLNLRN